MTRPWRQIGGVALLLSVAAAPSAHAQAKDVPDPSKVAFHYGFQRSVNALEITATTRKHARELLAS